MNLSLCVKVFSSRQSGDCPGSPLSFSDAGFTVCALTVCVYLPVDLKG